MVWYDGQLPPESSSIYTSSIFSGHFRFILKKLRNVVKPYKWVQPENFKNTINNQCFPLSLYNYPNPSDISQGSTGSCWFSSALASLTTNPIAFARVFNINDHLCKNSLTYRPINKNGIYQFRLCIRGIWQLITVDDLIPIKASGMPAFSKLTNGQLYPLLLEKALAKVYGSYEDISYGSCAEGLQILTGHPCDKFFLNKNTCINEVECRWNQIQSAIQNQYLITGTASSQLHKSTSRSCQVYPILDSKEFFCSGKIHRLLKLRDTKERKGFKEDLHRTFSHFPDHVKQDFCPKLNDNRSFWISLEELYKFFVSIAINKVRPHWASTRFSSAFQNYASAVECYTFDVTCANMQEIDVELFYGGISNQEYERTAESMLDLCLILARVMPDGTYKCVRFKHEMNGSTTLNAFLAYGRYIVLATSLKAVMCDRETTHIDFDLSNCLKYNIVFHVAASHPLTINRTSYPSVIVSDLLHSAAVFTNNFSYHLNNDLRFSVLATDCSYGVFAENLSFTTCVSIAMDGKKAKNALSSRMSTHTEDYLAPRQRQCILFFVAKKKKSHFRISNSYAINYMPNCTPCMSCQPKEISDLFFCKSFYGLYYFRKI